MHLMKRSIRALTALVMAFALMMGSAVPAGAEAFEWLFGGKAAEVKDSALTDDGMIRVYLKSLGTPQKMHITLSGSYAVEGDAGFYFDRDARLTLSEAEGCVYMAVGGLTINMGQSLTLTRHKAEDGMENGIRIDESEKDALFCGDLRVTAENGGLKPVLTLHIEDYLCGVVAYEMSDSFPLEALKAQAVAARTYALQRKWSAGKRDYDVVDTTADQVYKGYIEDYVNVIEAVEATRGVVGVYGDGFATCYYTASNGGQTALASHIWGGVQNDGYLAMTEDPYDLENPSSLQNEITVSARCEGSAALKGMLMDALSEKMRADGWDADEWTFEAIEAIEPMDPVCEGSLMCKNLGFTLRVTVRKPVETPENTQTPEPSASPTTAIQAALAAFAAPAEESASPEATLAPLPDFSLMQPQTEPPLVTVPPLATVPPSVTETLSVKVSLSVYDQIKDKLSLGLNGSDYEVIAVETRADALGEAESFTLIMRRFGHGVGMSQRGAQQMAGNHGKTYMEILNFYYPGMSVERMNWPETELTDLRALPSGVGAARPKPTPTPTPAPLPALKDREYYAQVALETRSSSLNMRENPNTSARVVDQLAHGRRVIVSSEPDADGWVSVHTAESAGYVKLEYLRAE